MDLVRNSVGICDRRICKRGDWWQKGTLGEGDVLFWLRVMRTGGER
jgi:hypothetical protein